MTTTEAELASLMRLMEGMEDSVRDMQDEFRVMRDDLEEFLLAESDSSSTSASSSTAATPERAGQQKGASSIEQRSWTGDDGHKNLAMRARKRPRELFEDDEKDA